jgi:peptide/nickel transport system ATP-binding protein/oligopeptide transport system ATP-binding protein
MADILLSVRGLKTYFPFGSRWLGTQGLVRAVDDVELEIKRGQVLGLVGESGSGKTTLGRSILRLVEPTAGEVNFEGRDVMRLSSREFRKIRRRMQIVFQDPYATLNPRMQIKQIIAEPLLFHKMVPPGKVESRVVELLAKVGMEAYFMYRYPHEFSGGQRQRISIARALSMEPDFIVADEPVSALDVSVQAQIINILLRLQRTENLTILFISHDLAVVESIADRIAVMHQGKIVEVAGTDHMIQYPHHPYTKSLLASVLDVDPANRRPVRRRIYAPDVPSSK